MCIIVLTCTGFVVTGDWMPKKVVQNRGDAAYDVNVDAGAEGMTCRWDESDDRMRTGRGWLGHPMAVLHAETIGKSQENHRKII